MLLVNFFFCPHSRGKSEVNPKLEYRNTKQIKNLNVPILQTYLETISVLIDTCFGHLNFGH